MRFVLVLCMLAFTLHGSEELKKLGFSEFSTKKVFEVIDKYKADAPIYLKKLKDKDPNVRAESIKFFMDMPGVPSEVLVEALLKERNKEARLNLKKIIISAEDKLTFDEWKQKSLSALTEHLIKTDGPTADLLEIAKRNNSSELIVKLEEAFVKKSSNEDLMKVYKESKEKLKIILFKSVASSLSKEDLNAVVASKSTELRFKAASYQLSKGDYKALEVLVDLLDSEDEWIAKESKAKFEKLQGFENKPSFDEVLKKLISELGADSLEARKRAKIALTKLPKTASKKIEKFGLELCKQNKNAELRLGFLNILEDRVGDLIKKPGFIGVQLMNQTENGVNKLMISNVLDNTPAQKAAIKHGSEVLKVDKVSFENANVNDLLVHLKKIPAGTMITFSLKNPAGEVVNKKIHLASHPNVTDHDLMEQWKSKNLWSEIK